MLSLLRRGFVDESLVRPKFRVSDADRLSVGVGIVEAEDVEPKWRNGRAAKMSAVTV